jgi:hypothetical protein
MEVRAVLDEQQLPLSRVLNLKVGDTMMLNATPDSLVELRAGAIPLTRGRMGRRNHSIAVRAEAPLTPGGQEGGAEAEMSLVAVAMNALLAILLIARWLWLASGAPAEGPARQPRGLRQGRGRPGPGRRARRAGPGRPARRHRRGAETLADRIERAQALAAQLDERLNRPMVTPPPAASQPLPASPIRPASRPGRDPPAAPPARAPPVGRGFRTPAGPRGQGRARPRDAAFRAFRAPASRPRVAKETPRSRARIDDDLFDGPADSLAS